jgi:peptidyl-prolyl cis-trans isomerase SurA
MKLIKTKIFFFLFLFFFSENLKANIDNTIILRIENKIVTKYELKNKILSSLIISGKEINQDNINKLKKQSLDALINSTLKFIELEKYNYKDDPNRINEYLKSISNNNIDELKNKFNNYKLDYNLFLDDIKTQFKWQKLIYNIYSDKIDINENSVEEEALKIINKVSRLEEINISEIEILLNGDEKDADIISNLFILIKDQGFETVALENSIAASASKKGNLGWINLESLNSQFSEIIKNLTIGEISKPIRRQNSIIIFKLNDKRITKKKDINLEQLKKNLVNQKKNELFNLYSSSHLSKLKNTGFIEYKK